MMEVRHTGNPRTYFEIKTSKVRVTGSQSVKDCCFYSLCARICGWRILEQPRSIARLFQRGCSFHSLLQIVRITILLQFSENYLIAVAVQMTMLLRCPQSCGPLLYVVVIIVLTQLHLIISAPSTATRAPADDVTDHVTSSLSSCDVTTERRQSVLDNGVTSQSVRSNAAAGSATKNRQRRQLYASQGCGPVCNRCRQVRAPLALAAGHCYRYCLSVCLSLSVNSVAIEKSLFWISSWSVVLNDQRQKNTRSWDLYF